MENAVDSIDKIDRIELPPYRPAKAPLTVEHIAALLRRNYTQADIARLSNVSPQAVNQFINNNYEVLHPLIDNTDHILASKLKSKAIGIINSIVDSDIQKASLMQRSTAAGIFIDKYRLLSGQSTDNLAVDGALRSIHAQLFKLPAPVEPIPTNKPHKKYAKQKR